MSRVTWRLGGRSKAGTWQSHIKIHFPSTSHAAFHLVSPSSSYCEPDTVSRHLGTEGPQNLVLGHCFWFILGQTGMSNCFQEWQGLFCFRAGFSFNAEFPGWIGYFFLPFVSWAAAQASSLYLPNAHCPAVVQVLGLRLIWWSWPGLWLWATYSWGSNPSHVWSL